MELRRPRSLSSALSRGTRWSSGVPAPCAVLFSKPGSGGAKRRSGGAKRRMSSFALSRTCSQARGRCSSDKPAHGSQQTQPEPEQLGVLLQEGGAPRHTLMVLSVATFLAQLSIMAADSVSPAITREPGSPGPLATVWHLSAWSCFPLW